MTVTLVESPGDLPDGACPIAVDQVDGELARRWKRADARRHVEITGEQLALAATAVTAKRAAVPVGLAGPEPDVDALRRAAQSATAAAAKAAAMRAELEEAGERPVIDVSSERAVLDAEAYVHHLRAEHERAVGRGLKALYGANFVAMAVLAARGATSLAEPVMPVVALVPAAALLWLLFGVAAGRRRRHEAGLSFGAALASAGVHSVAGLTARRTRVDTWQRRQAEVDAAQRAAERAHERWARGIGADVPPTVLDQMLAAAAELRQAEEALRTAAAAHDEAVALAEGPTDDEPIVIHGAPDHDLLDRLLQGSAGCPIVVIAPDPDDRRRLADQVSASGEVIVLPKDPVTPAAMLGSAAIAPAAMSESSSASQGPGAGGVGAAGPPDGSDALDGSGDLATAPALASTAGRQPGPGTSRSGGTWPEDHTTAAAPADVSDSAAPSGDLRERVLETLRKALSLRTP